MNGFINLCLVKGYYELQGVWEGKGASLDV